MQGAWQQRPRSRIITVAGSVAPFAWSVCNRSGVSGRGLARMAVHRLLPVVFVGRTNRSAVHRRRRPWQSGRRMQGFIVSITRNVAKRGFCEAQAREKLLCGKLLQVFAGIISPAANAAGQANKTPRKRLTLAGCNGRSCAGRLEHQSSTTSNPEITPMPITAESSMLLETSVS